MDKQAIANQIKHHKAAINGLVAELRKTCSYSELLELGLKVEAVVAYREEQQTLGKSITLLQAKEYIDRLEKTTTLFEKA